MCLRTRRVHFENPAEKFSPKSQNNFTHNPKKMYEIINFFYKSLLFQKVPLDKLNAVFAALQKFFGSMSEKNDKYTICFKTLLSKCSSGQVECSFDNPAKFSLIIRYF